MAKDFTENSRYKSKYSEGYVTGTQYLVELISEKIAAKRKTTLPYKFWGTDEWKKTFLTQLAHANKLVKTYPVGLVIKALADRRCWKLESLGAKFILEPILKELVRQEATLKAASQVVVETKSELAAPPDSRRSVVAKKSLLGDL